MGHHEHGTTRGNCAQLQNWPSEPSAMSRGSGRAGGVGRHENGLGQVQAWIISEKRPGREKW